MGAQTDLFESIKTTLLNSDTWLSIGNTIIKIIVIIIVSEVILRIVKSLIRRLIKVKTRTLKQIPLKRSKTIQKLLESSASYIVRFLAFLAILSAMGIEMIKILAGAGLLGIIIGFGAQNLIKDIIAGFLIFFENQFAVGDTVIINTFEGTVEEIGLRTTKLIDNNVGSRYIIPNGNITFVTNLSVKKKGV